MNIKRIPALEIIKRIKIVVNTAIEDFSDDDFYCTIIILDKILIKKYSVIFLVLIKKDKKDEFKEYFLEISSDKEGFGNTDKAIDDYIKRMTNENKFGFFTEIIPLPIYSEDEYTTENDDSDEKIKLSGVYQFDFEDKKNQNTDEEMLYLNELYGDFLDHDDYIEKEDYEINNELILYDESKMKWVGLLYPKYCNYKDLFWSEPKFIIEFLEEFYYKMSNSHQEQNILSSNWFKIAYLRVEKLYLKKQNKTFICPILSKNDEPKIYRYYKYDRRIKNILLNLKKFKSLVLYSNTLLDYEFRMEFQKEFKKLLKLVKYKEKHWNKKLQNYLKFLNEKQ